MVRILSFHLAIAALLTTYYLSGDLGVTAEQIETSLERHFSLASRWGCVLLLDEADVFLAERSPQDFKRNSFVAGKKAVLILCAP